MTRLTRNLVRASLVLLGATSLAASMSGAGVWAPPTYLASASSWRSPSWW